jgi:hypothetical protein
MNTSNTSLRIAANEEEEVMLKERVKFSVYIMILSQLHRSDIVKWKDD